MKTTDAEKEWFRRMNGNSLKPEPKEKEKEKKPEGLETTPNMRKNNGKVGRGFQEVAGMDDLKRMVTEDFINVLNNRKCAETFGIKPPSILFYGPSGCGKTFFAEKMAEEVGIGFMKIVPDDLACTWIHGTQQKIGEVFREAEKKAPVLLFFDEFDAMVPHRTADEGNQYINGEVNEFLCMLNNASDRGIYVLAATNRPERIDKAVLRTGRIDEMLYIDMPDDDARKSLFHLALSKLPTNEDIDYDKLATLTKGYNCSDINYIVKIASRKMFNASIRNSDEPFQMITQKVLEDAISQRSPSINGKDLLEYERVRSVFSPNDNTHRSVRIGFRQYN